MPTQPPSEEWIGTLFRKIYRAYNERDSEATADCYAEDLEITINGEPGPPDRDGLLDAIREQWAGFPDITATETARLVAGDRVVTEMVLDGHNTGPFLGRRATANRWRVSLAWVCRVQDGRVREMRVYVDNQPLLQAVRRR